MPYSQPSNEFDYIVVGAGSAGCVLASQLALSAGSRVLLIEQGARSWHRHSHVPIGYPKLFNETKLTHGYETVPQHALAGRRIRLPAGKGLGGSSLINAMIYVRPHDRDLEEWKKICDTPSRANGSSPWKLNWNKEELNRHFDLIESRYRLNAPDASPELHSSMQSMLDKVREEGFPFIAPYTRTQFRGRRMTSWDTWIFDKQSRSENPHRAESFRESVAKSGFELLKGATVDRVIISNGRAIGVRILAGERGSESHEARARLGVILSAGAIGTPKLLMQSGIGPKEQLKSKVDCVFDAENVGRHLHDHLVFPIVLQSSMPPLPRDFGYEDRTRWLQNGSGPLASNIAELGAFLARDGNGNIEFAPHWTNLSSQQTESRSIAATRVTHPIRHKEQPRDNRPIAQWHLTPTHYLEYPLRAPATMAHSIAVTWLHPQSRGEIRWRKDGGWEIDPNYHADQDDVVGLVEAIQWTRRWIQDGPLQKFFAGEIMPGAKRSSDEQVNAIASRLCSTLYHYAGSCAMGAEATSVCDPQMRVRGVDGLFACDASVIPITLSGNTQATVMMLGLQLANWLAKQ